MNQKIAIARGKSRRNQAIACCPALQKNQRIEPQIMVHIKAVKNDQDFALDSSFGVKRIQTINMMAKMTKIITGQQANWRQTPTLCSRPLPRPPFRPSPLICSIWCARYFHSTCKSYDLPTFLYNSSSYDMIQRCVQFRQ